MAKSRTTAFFCKECGYESAKWSGQCPSCKAWNTFVEEPVVKEKNVKGIVNINAKYHETAGVKKAAPVRLSSVTAADTDRIKTDICELDRVLGGGIVEASLVLVGGDPGIGKSTLLLQMCYNLAKNGNSVLYISGEESLGQIKLRAQRVGEASDNLMVLCETSLDTIENVLENVKPQIVVIDSIQTMYREEVGAAPGSVSQVRETTAVLMQLAKGLNISIFIVGHVTKEGVVAGPRMLEHMVDTVLYFEGDKNAAYRILRSVKNRFGSTNEIGVFEMRQEGLAEVANPSEYMLTGRPEEASGSVVVCLLEGTRPILVEIQALVCDSKFGMPRRTANGIDYNRLTLLIAVLEKKAGMMLGNQDVYLNVVGGIRINEPALDLGIILAAASSFKNISIPKGVVAIGEVGLTGEVRMVNLIEKRLKEAEKLGFKKCIIPENNKKLLKEKYNLDIIGVKNVIEAMRAIGLK